MKYIGMQISAALKSSPWLVRDSAQFLERISTIPVSSDTKIYKVDVKDYFMSGDHSELVNNNRKTLRRFLSDKALATAIVDLEDHILSEQYVKDMVLPGRVWIVKQGSGMGLSKNQTLTRDIGRHFGLVSYFRFKDHITFALAASPQRRAEFFDLMRSRMEFVKIEVESVTSSTNLDPWTQFLDVELGFGKRWHSTGHLDIRPFRKPTTIWSPLSSSSSHPKYIHSNWPVQYLRHYCRMVSEQTTLQIFLEKFMADFVEGSPEHIAIPRMRTFLKNAKPIQCLPKSSQRTCAGNSSWMVIPVDAL